MPDPIPNFVSLTEVFALKTKISEAPHTWWRHVRAALNPYYDYEAQYETKPGARHVMVPVGNIRRIDEFKGDFFGATSKVWLKEGGPLMVKESVPAIEEKLSRSYPRPHEKPV